jgi:hypothetical protein
VDARHNFRVNTGLLAAALAAGCATGCGLAREFQPGQYGLDPPATTRSADPPASAAANRTVVPAGGSVPPGSGAGATQPTYLPQIPQVPGTGDPTQPMQPPRPLPQSQALGQPRSVPPTENGVSAAGGPSAAPGSPLPYPPTDSHLRATPTVTGGRLELAPYEVPTDRVIDLTRQLEFGLAQNRDLLGRIKELETLGFGREQALAEAAREIELTAAEASRTRAALQAAQAQVIDLQDRLKRIEEEDVRLLLKVIEVLESLLGEKK